jgi:hypothetical protein
MTAVGAATAHTVVVGAAVGAGPGTEYAVAVGAAATADVAADVGGSNETDALTAVTDVAPGM